MYEYHSDLPDYLQPHIHDTEKNFDETMADLTPVYSVNVAAEEDEPSTRFGMRSSPMIFSTLVGALTHVASYCRDRLDSPITLDDIDILPADDQLTRYSLGIKVGEEGSRTSFYIDATRAYKSSAMNDPADLFGSWDALEEFETKCATDGAFIDPFEQLLSMIAGLSEIEDEINALDDENNIPESPFGLPEGL
jgi:hypothetical protein